MLFLEQKFFVRVGLFLGKYFYFFFSQNFYGCEDSWIDDRLKMRLGIYTEDNPD